MPNRLGLIPLAPYDCYGGAVFEMRNWCTVNAQCRVRALANNTHLIVRHYLAEYANLPIAGFVY